MRGSLWFEVRRYAAPAFFCLLLVIALGNATAAQLQEAELSQIIKDVQLLPAQATPRAAAVKDAVRNGTAVRTGTDSRAELTFADQTLARMGANTIFSFNEGTRDLNLGSGVMLVHVPKGAGGAKIVTAGVTAGITGTTVMIEYHKGAYIKLISLEGTVRMWLAKRIGQSVLVLPGQMLIVKPNATSMPDPVDVDLERLVKTSLLIIDFPPLRSQPLIAEEIRIQRQKKSKGKLIDTNMVMYGGGNGAVVRLGDPPPLDTLDLRFANIFPAGGGGSNLALTEVGALNSITTPNPYVINSTTKIRTAPTITTNGIVDQGKLYRGPGLDGPPSTYLFGSTSSFDQTSTFDEQLRQAANLPLAAFKFNSLQLTGNPTITIPAGGATKLVLVSIGALTSGPPGGSLSFAGLNTVILATQNGSIILTPDIDFKGIPILIFHARGAASNLTLGSQISGPATFAQLQAEGSVQVNAAENINTFNVFAGVDFLDGTGHVVANNISITAGNNINFTSADFAVGVAANPSLFLQAAASVNIDVRTDQSVFNNASSVNVAGKTITFTADPAGDTLAFNNLTPVQFTAGAGGIQASQVTFLEASNSINFMSVGGISAARIAFGDTIQSTGGNITTTTGDLDANVVAANGSIASGGDLFGFQSISAGTTINAKATLLSPSVTAGGNIQANHVQVLNINLNAAPPFTSMLSAGGGGITPFIANGNVLHTFNVSTVVSPNGIDFNSSHFGPGQNGGLLNLNAQTQTFGAGGISGANFDGAPQIAPGQSAGNGGAFQVNSLGKLSMSNSTISATTGSIDPNDPPSGAGGSVTLTSADELDLTNGSKIQVSSADPLGAPPPRRSSATGGTISINNSKTSTATAILIDNSSQLLAMLANAPPPNTQEGRILVSATSGGAIQVDGHLLADHGLIDVRGNGALNLNNPTLHADFIKVAALSPTGVLTINGGMITADSVLRLYADGSNGQILFNANCTLNAIDVHIIAARTITIAGGVTVNITGLPADIYTDVPNYAASSGGNGSTTGVFGGLGPSKPQPAPFNQRPPLPGPTGH